MKNFNLKNSIIFLAIIIASVSFTSCDKTDDPVVVDPVDYSIPDSIYPTDIMQFWTCTNKEDIFIYEDLLGALDLRSTSAPVVYTADYFTGLPYYTYTISDDNYLVFFSSEYFYSEYIDEDYNHSGYRRYKIIELTSESLVLLSDVGTKFYMEPYYGE